MQQTPVSNKSGPARSFLKIWLLPLAIMLSMGGLALFGDSARELLRYDRELIPQGQWWRIFSAHWVHLGFSHYLLNMAGLILIQLLVGRHIKTRAWLFLLLVCSFTITFGVMWVEPGLLWYVGFSGILHGLLLYGALMAIRAGERDAWLLFLLVIGKVVWEQLFGSLPSTAEISGGPVAINAHLFGAVGGLFCALVMLGLVKKGPEVAPAGLDTGRVDRD